eukprot:13136858-Ditylum_brightwellii.AAC.1
MLIACVYPVMKTYCLKGGMIGYKEDVLKIEQDISSWIQRLQSLTSSNIAVAYPSLCKQPTLPEDGSVEGEANVVEEEELEENAENISAAARETNVSPIRATLGPKQGNRETQYWNTVCCMVKEDH